MPHSGDPATSAVVTCVPCAHGRVHAVPGRPALSSALARSAVATPTAYANSPTWTKFGPGTAPKLHSDR
eukprot:6711956-Karenia_brevis.AAC.1